jgi:hypothetical protein
MNRRPHRKTILARAIMAGQLVSLLIVVAPSWAADVGQYFTGKTLRIVVGYAPGGGYDTIARLFAVHFHKHLPGQPLIQVVNMPGAGSEIGLRYVMKAKADGLTILNMPKVFIIRELLGEDIKEFDYKSALYLGQPDAVADAGVLMARTQIATTWKEIANRGKPATNGETEVGTSVSIPAAWLELIGAPIKNVYGYGGGSEVLAAFNRGELDLTTRASEIALIKRSFPEWLEKKPAYLTPIVRWRGLLGKDFLDAGKWPQPPDIFEIAKGTEPQRAALEAWMELGTGSKVFTLPPGVPADAYQALKKSFEATVADPAFVKDATARGVDVTLLRAENLLTSVKKVTGASDEVRQILRKLYTGK